MTKSKKFKPRKAWIVLYFGRVSPVGNGRQWQYPIFLNLDDAREFSREFHGEGPTVKPVLISEYPTPRKVSKPKKKK